MQVKLTTKERENLEKRGIKLSEIERGGILSDAMPLYEASDEELLDKVLLIENNELLDRLLLKEAESEKHLKIIKIIMIASVIASIVSVLISAISIIA